MQKHFGNHRHRLGILLKQAMSAVFYDFHISLLAQKHVNRDRATGAERCIRLTSIFPWIPEFPLAPGAVNRISAPNERRKA
jgi:hypothetical protein